VALIVVDASVLIAFLEVEDALHDAAVAALKEAADDDLILGATTLLELLVTPYRRSEDHAERVKTFVRSVPLRVEPITEAIADAAARLRARHRTLAVPDALTLAVADAVGADAVLTADRRWRTLSPRVRVVG
jgi:predicted nucleic acid-binding protein